MRLRTCLLAAPCSLLLLVCSAWLLISWTEHLGGGSWIVRRLAQADWEAFHDERFHHHSFFGNSSDADIFFEGVYMKFVAPRSEEVVVLIPGLLLNRVNASASEAFLSVVHGARVNYYRFPVEEFHARDDLQSGFHVTLGGKNIFADTSVFIDLEPDADDDAHDVVRAEIQFEGITPWTTRLLHPSTMGILGWMSGMECYHHVLSLHHTLRGFITLTSTTTPPSEANSEEPERPREVHVELDEGAGYMEKDWGSSFPTSWVWAQSNHFTPVASVATAPSHEHAERPASSIASLTKSMPVSASGAAVGQPAATAAVPSSVNAAAPAQPVALFLSIARVPLPPFAAWMSSVLGWSSPAAEQEHQMLSLGQAGATVAAGSVATSSDPPAPVAMGFVAGFLFEGVVRIFASYQFDSIVRFDLVREPSSGKELVRLAFVDAARSGMLEVELHKPVDEEALLANSSSAANASGVRPCAPIVAGLYGPRHGRMEKYVKESLLGGHMELRWSALMSPVAYGKLSSADKEAGASAGGINNARGGSWLPTLVGTDPMYSSLLYHAIARPSAMEVQGDIAWLARESEHLDRQVLRGVLQWMVQPHHFAAICAAVLTIALSGALAACARSRAGARSAEQRRGAVVAPSPTAGKLMRSQAARDDAHVTSPR